MRPRSYTRRWARPSSWCGLNRGSRTGFQLLAYAHAIRTTFQLQPQVMKSGEAARKIFEREGIHRGMVRNFDTDASNFVRR